MSYMARKSFWISCSVLFLLTACYYDNEEELYPDTGGPRSNISYSKDVEPLIRNNCYVCHSDAARLGNVILEGYPKLILYVNDGSLLGSITHDSRWTAMPSGSARLPQSQIDIVRIWIEEGAKNN